MRPMKVAQNDTVYLKSTLSALFVDSSRKDMGILVDALQLLSEPRFDCTHVEQTDQALACLDRATFDAVVLDGGLAEGVGREALHKIRGRDEGIVIILLAGPGQKTPLADEPALKPYAWLSREEILRSPNFFPGVLRQAISVAKAKARSAESFKAPPERRHNGGTRRLRDRRRDQMGLSQALENVERCLLAGPSPGGLEAWVAELQRISDTAVPLMEEQFGQRGPATGVGIHYGADQRPSQLQAIRRCGRSLLADFSQFQELLNNAASEICGSYPEQPDFNRISDTLSKCGLSLILECRRHEAKLAASAQESAYWEDGGGG